MGYVSSIKERLQARQSYGRVSKSADIGIDVDRPAKSRSAEKDNLFESNEERRERRKAQTDGFYKKINSGFDKYEKGVKTVQKFGDIFGGSSGGKKGRKSDDLGFGSFGFGGSSGGSSRSSKSDDLGFSSFGSMAGFGSDRKPKKSAGRRKEVPIYKGSRIVGYRQTGGKKKAKKERSIFDI